jgi:hypothetical protein
MSLGGSDWGINAITAVSRASSAGPTGVLKFWGLIPISIMNIPGTQINMDNLVTAGVNIQRLAASDQLLFFAIGSTATKAVIGQLYFVADN